MPGCRLSKCVALILLGIMPALAWSWAALPALAEEAASTRQTSGTASSAAKDESPATALDKSSDSNAPAPKASDPDSAPGQTQERPAVAPGSNQPAKGFRIYGDIKSGSTPLPGVTVTATEVKSGKKVITSTGLDGSYALEMGAPGSYEVRAEMTAFAPLAQQITLTESAPSHQLPMYLTLQSRVAKPEQPAAGQRGGTATTPTNRSSSGAPVVARSGRGTQQLSVTGDESALSAAGPNGGAGGDIPSLGNLTGLANSADAANQSVAVGGQMGTTAGFMGGVRTSDELRERMQEMRDQRGFGGPGGPGGAGGPGGPPPGALGPGAFVIRQRGFDVNQPHGTIYYSAGNSGLDASPYALNGNNSSPAGNSNRFGGLLGGPLKIPHVIEDNKTFFFGGYTGTRASNPYVSYSNVPTLLERSGDFSQSVGTNGQPVQLNCPSNAPASICTAGQSINTQQFQSLMTYFNPNGPGKSSPSQALLNYIPLPNLSGQRLNYRYANTADNNTDTLFLRLIHNFGSPSGFGRPGGPGGGGRGGRRARNNVNFNFNWQRGDSGLQSSSPYVGGSSKTSAFNTGVGWAAGKGRWNNTLRVNFNRMRVDTSNLYAGVTNIANLAGINGVSGSPSDWGLPNLSFTGLSGVTDIAPVYRNDSTLSLSEMVQWNKGKHGVRFGGDIRRLWTTLRSNANPRGAFTFTGFATGNSFADFLLGDPQSTALQYSGTPYYFSTNSYDLFLMDDWRVRSNFTVQFGLRYEYISPYSEQSGRMANLDVASNLTQCAAQNPNNPQACVSLFPPGSGLIQPDRNNFAPRVGFAWRVQSSTVVRGGYGINYNVSEYSTVISQLAYQYPYATVTTPIASTPGLTASGAPITLANGFSASTGITNSYAVNPSLRIPYVQMWNLNVQHEFGSSLVVNVGYNGSKGTALDIVTAPNRTATGLLLPNVQAFNYLTSAGSSILHAASLRVRKRLSRGLSMGGLYIFSKSIDNASSIGGSSVVVAQDPNNLAAERGLSSFDQRHKFTGDFLYELPFGTNKRWFNSPGPLARTIGEWTISGNFTIASGTPLTPYVVGNVTDVARGSNGSLRANMVPGQSISVANPGIGQWFNTGAFVAPAAGQYGTAGRNIIIGPGTILFNMSVAKTIPFRDTKSLEFRMTANNVFNHANYTVVDTNVNSPTFGQVTSVGAMRTLQFSSRLRF